MGFRYLTKFENLAKFSENFVNKIFKFNYEQDWDQYWVLFLGIFKNGW
jgi:hypothetical protein